MCCACNISTNAHKFCHQCVFANDICNPWANIPNVIFCQLSFQSIVSCPKTILMTPQHLCILFLFAVTNHIKQALPAECTVNGVSQISRKNNLISSGGWKSECEAGGECTQPLWMSPESKGNFCLSQMLGTTWLQTSDVSTQSYFWDFPDDINFHIFSTYQVLPSPLLSNIKYLEDGELMWCSRCHRLRALIFCQTLKSHSLGALGRAWERLRSIFPATGAKLPHPTEPQLPRLAAFQFISVALIYIFELLLIHFHLFQRYIINVFDIFMSPGKTIFTAKIPPPSGQHPYPT